MRKPIFSTMRLLFGSTRNSSIHGVSTSGSVASVSGAAFHAHAPATRAVGEAISSRSKPIEATAHRSEGARAVDSSESRGLGKAVNSSKQWTHQNSESLEQ